MYPWEFGPSIKNLEKIENSWLVSGIPQNYQFSCTVFSIRRSAVKFVDAFVALDRYDVRVSRYNAHETHSMVKVETAVVGRPRLIAALQTPRRLGITRLINLPTGCVGLEYRQR